MCHEDGAEWEFGFCDCVSLLSLETERRYMFEDIWMFSIKQKGVLEDEVFH